MATDTQNTLAEFRWEPQPAAGKLVQQLLQQHFLPSSAIASLAARLLDTTGTRLLDWIYSLTLPGQNELFEQLRSAGFTVSQDEEENRTYWRHPQGIFPLIVTRHGSSEYTLTIKVNCVEDLLATGQWPQATILASSPAGRRREALLDANQGIRLTALELHGCQIDTPLEEVAEQRAVAEKHFQYFLRRQRDYRSSAEGFTAVSQLVGSATAELGVDWACDLFFAAERTYWMSRNHAARVQYQRQQDLGMGWANHDHHTYRSSRDSFHLLVGVLEQLGFACRERFYAGQEAGWGAQVLEQTQSGIVVFADVDLLPEEITGDIAHNALAARRELGTVGLWCALHGESLFQAGMHHLECQFDFDACRAQLAEVGVETMAPFTNFPHLKQAFTQGEVWQIAPSRIDALLAGKQIDATQAEQFRRDGTIGSHLEILERNDGYKGFNQTGVSDIIARTDPRKW
ncbi:MAG: hypothetical protein MI725_05150 [Pirellulales bacterium]|nr:hypothetical protein [Pirellulales bacterium]